MNNFGRAVAIIGPVVAITLAGLAIMQFGDDATVDTPPAPAPVADAPQPAEPQPAVPEPDPSAVELARLGALPGATLQADLITIARAATECIESDLGAPPAPQAVQAMLRYVVTGFAIRSGETSPLIDPRLHDLATKGSGGAAALRARIEDGSLTKEHVEEWRQALAAYMEPAHPLYAGLDLAGNDKAEQDFAAMIRIWRERNDEVAACYRARVGG